MYLKRFKYLDCLMDIRILNSVLRVEDNSKGNFSKSF